MSSASRTYDFAVYGPDGHLRALLDAKRRFGTDQAWARAWHALAVEHTVGPPDASIVLIVPDRIYAWRPGAGSSASPDWAIAATALLSPYFERLKIPVQSVQPKVFEEIVGLWLHDVAESEQHGGLSAGDAGDLLDILRGGDVVERAAA